MYFGKYVFNCTMKDDSLLPVFTGSTFRGAFGHALKRVVCALKHEQCSRCLLIDRCVYAKVFETSPGGGLPTGPSPPHPFVIEPPLSGDRGFRRGESFVLGLLLFGEAAELLPYFFYAIKQMGEAGIGRRLNGHRPRFSLESITSRGIILYQTWTDCMSSASAERMELDDFLRGRERCNKVTVVVETPLRLKHDNRLQGEIPFHVLIRAALRRIADLSNHFGDGEPPLDYSGLVRRAGTISTVHSDLEWTSLRRYSNRQKRTVSIGGVLGSMTYQGELGEFLPVLKYCERVHMGKATTFGFGKIRVIGNSCSEAF